MLQFPNSDYLSWNNGIRDGMTSRFSPGAVEILTSEETGIYFINFRLREKILYNNVYGVNCIIL